MTELASRGVTFGYEIADEKDRILAEGTTRHVFADTAGRPRRAPPEIIETLEAFRAS